MFLGISNEKFNIGIRTTSTFDTIKFLIVKPFSTTTISKLASNNDNDNDNNLPPIREVLSFAFNSSNTNNSNENNSDGNNSNPDNLNDNNSDNGNNSSHEEVLDDNSSRSNSPRISSGVSGYETDSNRPYFEEGADAMAEHPVEDLPDDHLIRYVKDTENLVRHPNRYGMGEDEALKDDWDNRNQELRYELQRRKDAGLIEEFDAKSYYTCTTCEESDSEYSESQDGVSNRSGSGIAPTDGVDSGARIAPGLGTGTSSDLESVAAGSVDDTNGSSSLTKKRKFEDDGESSTQPSNMFKQDSSDITGETEPYDFIGGEDS